MKIKRKSGYSKDVATMYIPSDVSTYSLSTDLSKQVKWLDGKPTDEVTGYQSWFIAEGTEPFKVKFTNKVELPAMLTKVKLQDLEACEVGNNVYFKAKGIEVSK
ncbi:hypothetical protein EFR95_06240 [Lactobacillus amylovorus]|jgi:hypothetical protein|uniref:hypothetical protein n=1 Tax=Lactobacillus amylovorus TaxID=1604 RepID=UPI0021A45952|nr:hypothetical protein [Lactobacillus amylovorus]MCT3585941.1 hypothetical protein [Lactobacillus amylovorus]